MLDEKTEAVLKRLEEREAREHEEMRATPPERLGEKVDEWLIAVGRDVGTMMNILARSIGAKVIVELGLSYGFSALFLADAARATGGRVESFEIHPKKIAAAKDGLTRAGLADYVHVNEGDALETLPRLEGPIDFVLVDLWKELYEPCFDIFLPKLRPGAIVVSDNMLFPPDFLPVVNAYQSKLRATGQFESILLPVGNGIEISRFVGK